MKKTVGAIVVETLGAGTASIKKNNDHLGSSELRIYSNEEMLDLKHAVESVLRFYKVKTQ